MYSSAACHRAFEVDGACGGHGSEHASAACLLRASGAMATSDAFAKLLAYIKKEADTLKVLQRNSLKERLLTGKASSTREGDSERFKHYKIYLMLEKKMSAEQKQVIEEWERRNCVHWRPAFRNFYSVAEQHLEEMKALRKATLSEVCNSYVAKNNSVWGGVCRAFVS